MRGLSFSIIEIEILIIFIQENSKKVFFEIVVLIGYNISIKSTGKGEIMNRILLCDENIETLKILSFIIEQKQLGEVIDEIEYGDKAIEIISSLNPDIVITDYSLIGIDGNEVIRRTRNKGFEGKFIMISAITDPEVISKAYRNGVSFYIRKPININETIHIIEQTLKLKRLESMTSQIRELIITEEMTANEEETRNISSFEKEVDRILISLGLQGTGGFDELKDLILLSSDRESLGKNDYLLSELYNKISHRINEKPKTIEQKIRRSAQRAMDYVALIGLEDYNSLVFDRYAAALFDFYELRKQMNYLSGKSSEKGSIQIRKFIEGVNSLARDSM